MQCESLQDKSDNWAERNRVGRALYDTPSQMCVARVVLSAVTSQAAAAEVK